MRKLKKTTKQYLTVAALCIIVMGGTALSAYLVMMHQMKEKYDVKYTLIQQEMEDNQRLVYVAKEDIPLGERVTTENTEYTKVYATQPQETYLTKENLGKVVMIDVSSGTQLLSSMVTDNKVDPDVREVSYDVITVNSNIVHNDTVDIRLLFPNGENYIVLSKKLIKNVSDGSIETYFWLTEEEITRMSSAIVDAYLYTGSILYTTKYIEPNLQKASVVNYTPSLATLELIKNNPNIVDTASKYLSVEVRKELENRLAQSTKLDVTDIEWSVKDGQASSLDDNQTSNENMIRKDEDGFVYYTEEETAQESDKEYGE